MTSSYNILWGNTTHHSGTISIDNLLNQDPLFVDPWTADYRVLDSSPAKNSASDGGHRGAAGVMVPDTDPKVTATVEIYTGATISPTVCAVAGQSADNATDDERVAALCLSSLANGFMEWWHVAAKLP